MIAGMRWKAFLLTLTLLAIAAACNAGKVARIDRKPSYSYAPPPPEDLSLKEYDRVIIGRFQVLNGIESRDIGVDFPERIYHKLNFYHPQAFKDVRLWEADRPGLLVTGYIVEYNPTGQMRRVLPRGRGSAVFGVEVVLRDNLSGREIARFSYREPWFRPDMSVEEIVDAVAREIAGYLAYCRRR